MSETIQIDTSELEGAENEVSLMVTRAESIAIINQKQYEDANGCLIAIKGKIKELDSLRKSITRPIDEGKKRIMDLFSPHMGKLETARTALTRAMMAWDDEQERKRRELQAKLQREAEEKARKEQERLQARAQKWEGKGNADKAEALREQAEEVVPDPVPVVLEIPKVQGRSYRDNWKAVVEDVNQVPREYMIPDQKALDKIMQATKGTLKIPGVRAVNDRVLMSRAG